MTFWKLMQYRSVKPVKQFGFTLIELMVVVAVIAILASIAFPSYQNYVLRAGRTDARDALLNIAQQLERHYTQNNSYTSFSGAPANSPAGLYSISVSIEPSRYTVTATAGTKQSKDSSCNTFTIDHTGAKTSRSSGGAASTGCW